MQIGLRVLGEGHPGAFWKLSREHQLDTLALLQVEMFLSEETPKERAAAQQVANKIVISDEARKFWANQGFSA